MASWPNLVTISTEPSQAGPAYSALSLYTHNVPYVFVMFCVCLLTIFLIKLLLEPDQAYFGICLYLYLYSHLNLMFCICLLTLFLIMLLLVILSQISKQPCGSSVAWSECRIVPEASAHSVWDTCVYLDSQLQNLYFCICNKDLNSISTAICIWITFDVI